MTELRKEQKAVEGKNAGFDLVQHRMTEPLGNTVDCEKAKRNAADNNSISDHAGIILDALNDYRMWFSENEDSDKEMIKLIDDAIEIVQCA
jgi:hypothetical protein